MNVSFRQLKAFLLVARFGNFTRAAEQLHLTQAGLSLMMRELEAQLDARLFDRTTRSVTLTPAGEKFLPSARIAVEQLEASLAQLSEMGEKARQTLRVAATPLVSSSLLPEVCKRFRLERPEVTIQLEDCEIQRVHALVENGAVDVGLGFFFKASKGLQRRLLYEFQLMRVSPATTGAARGKHGDRHGPHTLGSLPWTSLREEKLIGLPAENPLQQLVEIQLAQIGRANESRPAFNQFDTLIAMVEAGMGTAVIPTFALLACQRHRVRTDLLVPAVTTGFYEITKRGRHPAPATQEFNETLVSMLPLLSGESREPGIAGPDLE